MRLTALIACALVVAGCSKEEAAPVDTTAAVVAAPASTMSLESVSGVWNVSMMPEGRDTVLTSYVLNTTDTAAWMFQFPNRPPLAMRVTGTSGDSLMTEAGPFESGITPGLQVKKTTSTVWLQDGKLVGRTRVSYDRTGPDSVVNLRMSATRQ